MEITTKETSELLIAAGMPVPDVKVGQIWYEKDTPVMVTDLQNEPWPLICIYEIGRTKNLSRIDEKIYHRKLDGFTPAFTATDILQELGGDISFSFIDNEIGFMACIFCGDDFTHINPAEAAALAFIARKNA